MYNFLENRDEGEKKKLPSLQIAFEQSFNTEIDYFVDIILHAHQLTMNDISPKGLKYQMRMTKSTLMNGNIKGLLFDQFPNEMKESKSSRFYLHRQKEFILLFKKFGDNLLPLNISTKNSKKILSQMTLDFEEDLPIIFIGYTVNPTWDRIKQVCAVYIKDGKKQWISDLLARGGAGSLTVENDLFTPVPVLPAISVEEIPVRPKQKTKPGSQKAS